MWVNGLVEFTYQQLGLAPALLLPLDPAVRLGLADGEGARLDLPRGRILPRSRAELRPAKRGPLTATTASPTVPPSIDQSTGPTVPPTDPPTVPPSAAPHPALVGLGVLGALVLLGLLVYCGVAGLLVPPPYTRFNGQQEGEEGDTRPGTRNTVL